MRAVVEAARRRQLLHVRERLLETAVRPELQLADAGRVDDDAPAGQHDQLAVRRRVPALVVVGARLLHRHQLAAGPAVDERRLADPARADQDRSDSRPQARPQRVEALTGHGGDNVH